MQVLTLKEWADKRYKSRPPSLTTLSRYARLGFFCPPARKEGGMWRVREDADLVGMLAIPSINTFDDPILRKILKDDRTTS
ncbi:MULTISPECIES: excisionase [Proteus]|uniref:Excisionase n=1 Tax=Proteus penneri TaxID=102862 RepID=A0ABS0VYH9_9GAMM|nr:MULTISPECIES: excisionase [Proteus]MBJ2116109.1 excisionase [Proteus penneri]MCO8052000.1 excisionase [Proteus penneri]NBM97273.1 excisionase [Proteus sp. G2660]QPT34344.1 excisionase [Proteus penneri]